jgi:outer membrane lipoprotein SlyB
MKAFAIIRVVLVLGLVGCQKNDSNENKETTTPHTLDKE